MASLDALRDLVAGDLDGVARLVIRHERRRKFRWLFLFELLLVFMFCMCLIPVAIVLFFVGAQLDILDDVFDADLDFDVLAARMFTHWHEVVVELRGPEGEVMGAVSQVPATPDERDALVQSILAAADKLGLVVTQTLGGTLAAHLATWYGGQPLMAEPEARHPERALREVERAGAEVQRGDREMVVTLRRRQPSRLMALVGVALTWWFEVWTRQGREHLAETWADAMGEPAPVTTFEVRGDGLLVRRARGEREQWRHGIDATDLLGVAWASSLALNRSVTRERPRIRVFGRRQAFAVDVKDASLGPALVDLIVEATLDYRDRHPIEGVRGSQPQRARCPYCTTLFVFAPNASCPNCGAPPIDLKADW